MKKNDTNSYNIVSSYKELDIKHCKNNVDLKQEHQHNKSVSMMQIKRFEFWSPYRNLCDRNEGVKSKINLDRNITYVQDVGTTRNNTTMDKFVES